MAFTIHNFEKFVDRDILVRGKNYFESGHVNNLKKTNEGAWTAYIEGDDFEDFATRIGIKDEEEIKTWNCTCPYDGYVCKHVVALMYAVRERMKKRGNGDIITTMVKDETGVYTPKSPIFVNKGATETPKPKPKNEPKDYSAFGLYKAYRELGKSEQRALKIAALAWESLSQTKFIEIFNSVFSHEGRSITPALAKLWFLELSESGHLLYLPTGYYRIKQDFADYLLDRDFDNDTDFKHSILHIKRRMEATPYRYRDFEPAERYFRDTRLAYYQNDIENFIHNYYTTIQTGSLYSQNSLMAYFMPDVFDEQKVERASPRIRSFLLSERLSLTFFSLTQTNDYYDYTAQNLSKLQENDRSNLARMVAQIAFFKGDWEKIATISQSFDGITGAVFVGIQALLRGEPLQAVESFDIATKIIRKESRNPKNYLTSLAAIFQILAQLKTQDPNYFSKIEDTHKKLTKNASSYGQSYDALRAVVHYLKNEKLAATGILKNILPNNDINRFFTYLAIYWIDEKLLPLKSVKNFADKLLIGGYHWAAHEILTLLNRIEPRVEEWVEKRTRVGNHLLAQKKSFGSGGINESKGLKISDLQPLVDLMPRIEDWENALNALLSISSGTATKPTAKENDARLVWLVDFERLELQPKEQVFSKGGWTNGRNVSLQKLKQGETKSMSDQDRRICRAIGEYATGWGYNTTYEIDVQKALPDLVGHPYLFLASSPQVAVQLVEDKPVLLAKEVKEGYQLSFSVAFSGAGWKILKESPTRYKLLKITEDHARIARAMNGDKLFIPAKGRDRLQKTVEGLSKVITIQSAFESSENLPSIPPDTRVCVHLLPVGDGFHVEFYAKPFGLEPPYLKAGVGESLVIATVGGERVQTKRNLKLEKENLEKLLKSLEILSASKDSLAHKTPLERQGLPAEKGYKAQSGTYQMDNAEQCLQFLMELQPFVANEEVILEWPKGEKFRITNIAGFSEFSMSVKEKNDWFEVKGELRVDENLVLSMQDLLRLSQSKSDFVELSPGRFLALTNEFRRRLQEINGILTPQKNGSLQLHRLATTAMQDFTDQLTKGNFDFDKKYKKNLDDLKKAFKTKFKVSENFNAVLRGYQIEGFEWLHRMATWGVGACLADDMGLGKTVQALAVLLDRAVYGPTLVVAPASVCRNWMVEIQKFTPTLRPILFGEGDRATSIDQAKKGDIVVTTYDLMTREADHFTKKKFATIILDEAQAIKNKNTKRSETAMALQGDFKIAMTGTPLENHLGELWNLFQFINPGLLGSSEYFTETFATPIERYRDDSRREQLRRLVQPFMLRRRKDEVLKELPAKTEIMLTVDLTAEERAFYEALRRQAIASLEKRFDTEGGAKAGEKHLQILAEIMRLRRAACHPKLVDEKADFVESSKLRLFGEVVEELLDNGHKALVFSQFVGHLAILEAYLKKKDIHYQYLDGQTPLKKRQERIEAFQRGEGDLFLVSLKAGGVGLNLTAADYVIHMDPWWNPAVEDQATDRAHRIGQEKPVTVYRLVTEGTIEEKILKLHEQKRDLADSLLSGADVSAKLSADELMALIKSR
jgi:SNF2 family DNA or RNA helicase